MREPTAEERARERPDLWTNLVDAGTLSLLILAAITSGSLTISSEAVRAVLLVAVSFYAYGLMWALHRGRLDHFAFGVGKLEQFVRAIVGLALVIAALWVAAHVVSTVFAAKPPASPLALVLAALVNALDLLVCEL